MLILGGSSKNSDFSTLAQIIINNNVSAVVLIGQEARKIKDEINRAGGFSGEFIEGLKNMKEIVTKASEFAISGGVVILSPGCASFGMFKNYSDRGDQFKKSVNEL